MTMLSGLAKHRAVQVKPALCLLLLAAACLPAFGQSVTTDVRPPTFTGFTASPPLAKLGTVVTFKVTASEALRRAPTLTIGLQPAVLVASSGRDHTFTAVISVLTGEGRPDVVARGTDVAGNVGRSSARPLVTDFRPPAFSSIWATPSLARIGTVVALTFVASEPLRDNPVVMVGTQQATFVRRSHGRYTYTIRVDRSTAEGSPPVSIRGTDLAGNVGTAVARPLVTDFTVPTATRVAAVPELAKKGTLVILTFLSSERLGEVPTVMVGGQQARLLSVWGLRWTFMIHIGIKAGEGRPPILIRARDLAGNEGTVLARPLVTDFTDPSFTDVTASSPVAEPGTTVVLRFRASERLSRPPAVMVGHQPARFVSANGLEYTFSVRMDRRAGSRNPTVVIEGTDLAGNRGRSTAHPFPGDSIPPSFKDFVAAPSVARLGTTVTLTFTASESLRAPPTVLVGGQTASYASLSGLTYTYTVSISSAAGEGSPTVLVQGTDLAGNVGSSRATPLITDFTLPGPASIDPPLSPTRFSTLILTGGKPAHAGVIVTRAGQTLASTAIDATVRWSASVGLVEQANLLQVVSFDLAGNVGPPVFVTVVLDTIVPPSPEIAAPFVESPTTKTSQTIHGIKAADTSLSMNGVLVKPLGPETTFSQVVTSSVGTNVYSFGSSDAAGNASAPTVVTIVVHNFVAAPTVDDLRTPTEATRLAVSGAKPANTRLSARVTNVEGTPGFTSSVEIQLDGSTTWGIPELRVAEGQNLLSFQCFDASESPSAITTRSVLVDTLAPFVRITGVNDGDTVTRATLTLGLSFGDAPPGTGIQTVRLYLDGQDVTGSASIAGGQATLPVSLVPGVHTFAGEATDGIGHTASTSATFCCWADDGQSVPVLTVSSFRNKAFTPANVFAAGGVGFFTLNYGISEPARLNVTVTNSQGAVVQSTTTPTVIPGKEPPVTFDGAYPDGEFVDVGRYTVILTPTNAAGRSGTPFTTSCAVYY
ncbi:MAG: hypothetical protein HY815_11080 [Candidatus Riflebacteria bacterium]|nr:hypothetical protein [Candidatus Riflebacteria bacterium]